MLTNIPTLIALLISVFADIALMFHLKTGEKKNQLRNVFICTLILLILWSVGLIAQIILSKPLNINPMYFDYIVYISICFIPVTIFFISLIFSKTKIEFKNIYLLLFVIPMLSLIILWTNDLHHLFYIKYSTNISENIYGKYLTIHTLYSYGILLIALINLIKYSIKNAGFFSKQSIMFFIGTLVPIALNALGTFNIINMSIYLTPISFSIAIFFYAVAIFKFKFLSITPIALQRIVDRISDGYIVINEQNNIIDFNETFLNLFHQKDKDIRNLNIFTAIDLIKMSDKIDKKSIQSILISVKNSAKMQDIDLYFDIISKYFHIEFSSLYNKKNFLGTLILFKDITQHIEDMQTIKDNQETLMESERLASLGQLIGGIAHNLKTPIMSISGAAEGLSDLVNEYNLSIDNPIVTNQDHHEIAHDMSLWISKIKEYTQYMSDVITAVKGQAVNLSETENIYFDLEELVKRIDILMKHELKSSLIYLNVRMNTDSNLTIQGDINSLIQVINNMISNSIQAYNGKTEDEIILDFSKKDNYLIISIEDHASGLPKKVQEKLFKEMITTKGKNGTGLGLYMSYSTIKAHFNGNITFETQDGVGTVFHIILPL